MKAFSLMLRIVMRLLRATCSEEWLCLMRRESEGGNREDSSDVLVLLDFLEQHFNDWFAVPYKMI